MSNNANHTDQARPANDSSEVVDGIVLAELDGQIQDLVRECVRLGPQIATADIARLGLVLADLTRVLPSMSEPEPREYFVMVECLARGALSALVLKGKHEC